MNLLLRQTTGSMAELNQLHSEKNPLPGPLYLLERSLNRYRYLKKHGAPDILVDAEKNLVRRRLLSFGATITNEVSGR